MLFGLFQVFFSMLVNDTAHLVACWMSVGVAPSVFWPVWMFRFFSCLTSSHLSSIHQASATRTTSACSPSPSTTGRSASWIRTIRVRVPLSLKLPSRPVSHSRCHVAGFVPNSSDDEGRYRFLSGFINRVFFLLRAQSVLKDYADIYQTR